MMKQRSMLATGSAAVLFAAALLAQNGNPAGVQVEDLRDQRRVDVTINGKPFTSYIYPATLQKPVLYPIRSALGTEVTRGYPLHPRAGERADHPHHVGHWFNHGDVNGYDFWGHSDATPAANKARMGTIVHKEIVKAAGGAKEGELVVRADWVIPDGSTLMREETRFVFSGAGDRRAIDRTTTWTAVNQPVTFKDTKEGAFGIRVARALDHPSKTAETLVGANGQTEKRVDTASTTGRYFSSDGKSGEDVWGTRGPWMALTGTIDNRPVTVAILDHPKNQGHPTYWHARGYGLFAANPLGRQGYDPKQEPMSFTLKPGESVTFRHRILVADAQLTPEQMRKEFENFTR